MKIFSTLIFCLIAGLSIGQSATHVCHHEDIAIFPLDNLNTRSIEFSPTYYEQGLVYVVAREKNNFLDPKTGIAYFDLMYADLGPDGEVSKSVNFSPNIRTQYHEGSCTFSSDGQEMLFTRSNLSGGQGIDDGKGQVQLKIYSAVKGAEDWEQITALPFCSDEYAVAHPALSDDGQNLIFSSDMPGGFGGMDLYIVNRKEGIWSTPVNLGATINTKGHELFPYWHPQHYVFFASDGHAGKGGLDIFVTAPDSSFSFSNIQHLEAPFNSSRDDLSMIVSSDGTSGYLASDRKPTKGKDDLYRWTSSLSIFCTPSPGSRAKKEILVLDESENVVSTAYVWLIPMNQEGPSLYKEHFSTALVPKEDKDGSFYLRWGITEELSAETADAISDAEGKVMLGADKKLTYIIVAQHDGYQPAVDIIPGDKIPSYIRMKKSKVTEANCLYTTFSVYNDDGTLPLNGAKIQLTGPCLETPLVFYTDELGSGTKCLPEGCTLKAECMQVGYAHHAFSFTPDDENEPWQIYLKRSDDLTAPPSPIASGTVIVLDNIYYDFNKSVIRQGEAGELIALAKILKEYPDLTIELTSHTDTRGTAEYNMELAEQRSESSKSYLILLGIDAARIITKAAGESAPRNKCLDGVPCTESEHQYNRRTEVRILNPAQGMEIKYKGRL